MDQVITHSWDLDEASALALQTELARQVVRIDRHDPVRLVAGLDVAYQKDGDLLVAAVVTLDMRTRAVVEHALVEAVARFPYIPGLFSFRELPPLAAALRQLRHRPDLLVCDGHGYAHPRRFGLACHVGVLFDIPTIGCGKTLLCGVPQPLAVERGCRADIVDNDEVVGSALRTQHGVRPVYVSVGHRVTLDTSCDYVLDLSREFRLPETTRHADHLVKMALKRLDANSDAG